MPGITGYPAKIYYGRRFFAVIFRLTEHFINLKYFEINAAIIKFSIGGTILSTLNLKLCLHNLWLKQTETIKSLIAIGMCWPKLCAMAKPARLNAVRTGEKAFSKCRPVPIDFGIGLPIHYNPHNNGLHLRLLKFKPFGLICLVLICEIRHFITLVN
jgi:hypothetical protein